MTPQNESVVERACNALVANGTLTRADAAAAVATLQEYGLLASEGISEGLGVSLSPEGIKRALEIAGDDRTMPFRLSDTKPDGSAYVSGYFNPSQAAAYLRAHHLGGVELPPPNGAIDECRAWGQRDRFGVSTDQSSPAVSLAIVDTWGDVHQFRIPDHVILDLGLSFLAAHRFKTGG